LGAAAAGAGADWPIARVTLAGAAHQRAAALRGAGAVSGADAVDFAGQAAGAVGHQPRPITAGHAGHLGRQAGRHSDLGSAVHPHPACADATALVCPGLHTLDGLEKRLTGTGARQLAMAAKPTAQTPGSATLAAGQARLGAALTVWRTIHGVGVPPHMAEQVPQIEGS